MRKNGLLVTVLVLLVVGCTMVSTRDPESTREVVSMPNVVSRPNSAPLSDSYEPPLPLPALTVDELPIVAAEIDEPGHLEYTDRLGDVVLFHALWNGTWYWVEAGVYDGELAGTYRYTAPEGWSFRYPMHWDRLDEESGFVQDTTTGKTLTFASQPTTQAELERWLESEIERKLAATEADNTLAEPLAVVQEGALTVYQYAILSRLEASETLLRTTVFFDGQRRYELYAAIPPVSEEEYGAIVASFEPMPAVRGTPSFAPGPETDPAIESHNLVQSAAADGPIAPQALVEAFFDNVLVQQMAEEHLAGATVAVV